MNKSTLIEFVAANANLKTKKEKRSSLKIPVRVGSNYRQHV